MSRIISKQKIQVYILQMQKKTCYFKLISWDYTVDTQLNTNQNLFNNIHRENINKSKVIGGKQLIEKSRDKMQMMQF